MKAAIIKFPRKFPCLALFVSLSIFQSLALAKVEAVLGKLTLAQNQNLAMDLPTTDAPEIILSRDEYVISYNKDRRSPNWAAWQVDAKQLGSADRSDGFKQDSELEQYLVKNNETRSIRPSEYQGTCFDRGHQVPSADRTKNAGDNEATFFMSNMVPQTPYLNRAIWKRLESYTRDLVLNHGKKVYVVAGPIYDQDFGMIGPRANIPVPSKNFKVLIILDKAQAPQDISTKAEIISVIMPNTLADGSPPPVGHGGDHCENFGSVHDTDGDDWQKFKTSLADIERLANITLPFK